MNLAKIGPYTVTVKGKTPTDFLQIEQSLVFRNALAQSVYQQKCIYTHTHSMHISNI